MGSILYLSPLSIVRVTVTTTHPFVSPSLLLPSRHSLFQAEDANEIELLNKLIFNLYLTFISRGTVYDNYQICSPVPDAV